MNECTSKTTNLVCECCGSNNVDVELTNSQFEYNDKGNIVVLNALLPVYSCTDCEMDYTLEQAELLRHDAVCKYHGVLTPDEIHAIRQKYKITVKDLSNLTGIGEASISRWESGKLIQSKANDTLLRLITKADNFESLSTLRSTKQSGTSASSRPNFVYIAPNQQLDERAQNFKL